MRMLQFVQYNDHYSNMRAIACGVPQGSIIGPLLLLICINDICNVSKVLEFILCADDTNMFYFHKSLEGLVHCVNTESLH